MQATCDHCGAKHVLDHRQIAGSSRVKFRCSKCSHITSLELTQNDSTQMNADSADERQRKRLICIRGFNLRSSARFCVHLRCCFSEFCVLSSEFIGRLGADFAIDDPDISRWHCVIEVRGEEIRLRDLDSRNGAFVRDERVRAAPLAHQAEFRIGNSRVRLAIQSA